MNVIIDGAKHILDPAGYDHILFLIALVASFDLSKVWRVILLATAFTVGHSLTLLLASIDFLRVDTVWVEFLIQVSIVIMAITATLGVSIDKSFNKIWAYCLTLGIGLIHGLGFSSYFRMHVDKGENILMPLVKFNLGVEVGQIIILLVALSLFSMGRAMGVSVRHQQIFVGGLALGLSTLAAVQKFPL